mgnify:FL=1
MCELIKVAGQSGVKSLKAEGIDIQFTDTAQFEEIDVSELVKPDLANNLKIVDNESSEEDLGEHISMDDLNELALTDPVEYERIKSGGEVSA